MPPKPRPPAKSKPLPNLTAEKKSGKAALNTFAELAAFFKKEETKLEVPPPLSERPDPSAPPPVEGQSPAESKPEPQNPPPSETTNPGEGTSSP